MPANALDADGILQRIRGEFLEMPGLCLTCGQASRLWNLDAASCDALLQALVAADFLRRTSSGTFVLAAPRARAA